MVMEKKMTVLKACFTCPICNNLYVRATTISECLHTFCRKCIEDKLVVENLKACPVCNVDLGVAPLDKLRADNTWDELRLKVFKQKPKMVKAAATETASTSLKYSRKKKTSLPSSLMATSSRVSTSSPEPLPDAPSEKLEEEMEAVSLNQPVPNFRRRQRKNLTPKKNETLLEPQQIHEESENGFEIILNFEQQDNGLAGASTSNGCIQKENNSERKDHEDIPLSSDDLGKSLSNGTALNVETVITPNGKANQEHGSGSGGGTEEVPGEANKIHVLVSSESDTKEVSGVEKQDNVSEKISGKKGKGKAYSQRVLRAQKQGNMSSAGTSEAAISKEAQDKVDGSKKQVWLSLIAASNQNRERPLLPQISSPYIRTDGNLPVSYVKKYLAYKLGLQSEEQVEIWLRQEPVSSTQKLHNLVDWWVQSTPVAERKSVMVGSSGAEFVMTLHYSGSHLFE